VSGWISLKNLLHLLQKALERQLRPQAYLRCPQHWAHVALQPYVHPTLLRQPRQNINSLLLRRQTWTR
jgi:hypothetical protein